AVLVAHLTLLPRRPVEQRTGGPRRETLRRSEEIGDRALPRRDEGLDGNVDEALDERPGAAGLADAGRRDAELGGEPDELALVGRVDAHDGTSRRLAEQRHVRRKVGRERDGEAAPGADRRLGERDGQAAVTAVVSAREDRPGGR